MLDGFGTQNARVKVVGTEHDFDTLASTLNDWSWAKDNIRRKDFVKLENNLYINKDQGVSPGQSSVPSHVGLTGLI